MGLGSRRAGYIGFVYQETDYDRAEIAQRASAARRSDWRTRCSCVRAPNDGNAARQTRRCGASQVGREFRTLARADGATERGRQPVGAPGRCRDPAEPRPSGRTGRHGSGGRSRARLLSRPRGGPRRKGDLGQLSRTVKEIVRKVAAATREAGGSHLHSAKASSRAIIKAMEQPITGACVG